MLYVILDLVGIVIASLLSQPLKHVLTTTQTSAMLDAATLCVGIIGIQGAITTKQPLLMLVSLVFGTLVGYWLDIDGRFTESVTYWNAGFTRQTKILWPGLSPP